MRPLAACQCFFAMLFRLLWRHHGNYCTLILPISALCLINCSTAMAEPTISTWDSSSTRDSLNDSTLNSIENPLPTGVSFQVRSSKKVQISKDSWAKYIDFTESTCRMSNEAPNAYKDPQYDYWNWEQSEFHKQLRKKLILEARSSHVEIEAVSDLVGALLPSNPLESYCKRPVTETAEPSVEKDLLYDALVNIIFPTQKQAPDNSSSMSNTTSADQDL